MLLQVNARMLLVNYTQIGLKQAWKNQVQAKRMIQGILNSIATQVEFLCGYQTVFT